MVCILHHLVLLHYLLSVCIYLLPSHLHPPTLTLLHPTLTLSNIVTQQQIQEQQYSIISKLPYTSYE